jgi:hypothetical protein
LRRIQIESASRRVCLAFYCTARSFSLPVAQRLACVGPFDFFPTQQPHPQLHPHYCTVCLLLQNSARTIQYPGALTAAIGTASRLLIHAPNFAHHAVSNYHSPALPVSVAVPLALPDAWRPEILSLPSTKSVLLILHSQWKDSKSSSTPPIPVIISATGTASHPQFSSSLTFSRTSVYSATPAETLPPAPPLLTLLDVWSSDHSCALTHSNYCSLLHLLR